MIQALSIVGTRPEAIKMASVITELRRYPDQIRSIVCATAPHRELLDQILTLPNIQPDIGADQNYTVNDLAEHIAGSMGVEPSI